MQRNFISRLRCPYTGSPFEVTTLCSEHGGAIDFGVLTSEGGEFPIISGVSRLLMDQLQGPLVELVKQGRKETALMAALDVPFLNRGEKIINGFCRRAARRWNFGLAAHAVGPRKRRLYRMVTQPNSNFVDLVAGAGADAWANWQTYRFSMPTFQAVCAFSQLAKGCSAILDFGCGLGHSAFLMKRFASNALMVCADYSFSALYLAKRYFVTDAQCICLDGDYPLPFFADYFDFVFSTDALQYIESKLGLASEFQRVLCADGIIALAHLHNRLSPVSVAKALTPRGYAGLFEGVVHHMYPEDSIVAGYVANGTMDLGHRWVVNDLNEAVNGLSLVAAKTEAPFTMRAGMWDAYIDAMRHPKINPAYDARKINSTWVLKRGIHAPYAVEHIIQDLVLLPETWSMHMDPIDSPGILSLRDADRGQLRELVRRFLVLELPQFYV